MSKTLSILAAAAACLALAACGKPASAPADPAAPARAAPAAGTVQGAAPAFAANYPGTTNSNWVEMGERAGQFNFETADAPDKVGAYYAGLGGAAGLTARPAGGAASVVYTASGAAGEITVVAAPANGKTAVAVTWVKAA